MCFLSLMSERDEIGRFIACPDSHRATAYDDLAGDFPSLYEFYEKNGVVSILFEGWLPMKLRQNKSHGSKLNDNYCLYVPGQNRYESAIPNMCSDLQTGMVFTNKVWYLQSIGKSSTEICEMLGLMRINSETGQRSINTAPIRNRESNNYHITSVIHLEMRNYASRNDL